MGQSHDKLGQQPSKEELLYQYARSGDVEAVGTLCREGASLEWIDQKGRTPLIVACLSSELLDTAGTLIRFHADVNAYRAGRHGGTPLHHAAKRGVEQTVKLLLSSGANALATNDECQTPLDVARARGHTSVVRTIENHICYFSGWMREFQGPGFLEALAPQLLSRKVWVVVTPRGASTSLNPSKFELSIYLSLMDSQPRTIISLWKAKIEDPKFHQSEPSLTIFDPSTKARYKLASGKEGHKPQLQWLYNACRGIPENIQTQARNPAHQAEAAESVRTSRISDQINTNGWADRSKPVEAHRGWGIGTSPPPAPLSEIRSTGWMDEPLREGFNGWGPSESVSLGNVLETCTTAGASGCIQGATNPGRPPTHDASASTCTVPSAPPIPEELFDDGRIQYPDIKLEPTELAEASGATSSSVKVGAEDHGAGSSSCVICWEAPVQGACVPCGHMAGCMACLTEIQAKDGACPVCRTPIDKVLRVFAV